MLSNPTNFYWLLIVSLLRAASSQDILVETTQGVLRGLALENIDGVTFYGFRSIPYAQPPLNDLRFRVPVPADSWDGVLDATGDIPSCTQYAPGVPYGISGGEDCLYLNVFVRELPTANVTQKPVMVYIHGGGFYAGAANDVFAGPEFIMIKDVILVSIHYRLGIFGFINFDDDEAGVPGNLGLKDQVLALKWVKDNIEAFGGDPDNILIFGNSAGAMSVHLHMLSPMSKGLFNKVLGQSGTAINPILLGTSNNGVKIAEQLGFQVTNLTETVTSLRSVSAVELSRAEQIIAETDFSFTFPIIESSSGQELFLSERPIDILLSGDYTRVPYVTGFNDLEGLLMETNSLALTGESMLIEDFTEFVPFDLNIVPGSEEERALSQRIKEFYYGDTEPSRDDIIPAVELYSDFIFGFPAYRAALEHIKTSSYPIYIYYFTADTSLNFIKAINPSIRQFPGAAHGDEAGYVFKTVFTPQIEADSVEDVALRSVIALWTNFAIYGDPTPDDSMGFTQTPRNDLRFKAQMPANGWEGIGDATIDIPPCSQLGPGDPNTISGTEDCLYLNVFLPEVMKLKVSYLVVLGEQLAVIRSGIIKSRAVKTQEPLIEISQGILRGFTLQNRDGGTFYGFRSIPYAQPPINDLRFRAPVPASGWEGIRDAITDIPQCPQFGSGDPNTITGTEDCLYLNVFIPELPSVNAAKKPVMVYIHGGGFFAGSASSMLAGPEFIMTQDVVLVSIHYRLGVFGFTNFDDPELEVPGNAGMKDQVLALKWVKENIEAFGGDSDNIVIFGNSAGSISVHLHMLSPMSTGLFNKALGISGVSIMPTMLGTQNSGFTLAEQLGIQTTNLTETLRTLRELPAAELSRAEQIIQDSYFFFSSPTIESPSKEESFLAERPIDIMLSGNYNQVPFLVGINDLEGLLMEMTYLQATGQSMLIEDFTEFIPEDLEITPGSEEERALSQRIKEFYYGDTEPSRDDIMPAIDLFSDFLFGFPTYRAALEHIKTSSNPVYVYYFTADTALNLIKIMMPMFRQYPGAAHGDEIGYVFQTVLTPPIAEGSVEDLAVKSVISVFTNFAIYGNPTPDDSLGAKWEPVEDGTFNYFHIGTYSNNASVNMREENMQFWSQIYEDYFPRK
ncbi:Carboxylesterase family [Popillia japonica]|uniref:Carboxylesterase family n=1 Tax=Popillia japonica TaxID=7064 RepID=A0AAW1KHG1_POPJA